MAGSGSIKLFQFYQNYSQTVGIYESQTNRNRYNINLKRIIVIISSIQYEIALVAYMLYYATFMVEYGEGFTTLITIVKGNIDYFIFAWKMEDILEFIRNCETFIEKSKSMAVKIERISFQRIYSCV